MNHDPYAAHQPAPADTLPHAQSTGAGDYETAPHAALCGAPAVARGATVAETLANVIAGTVGRPRAGRLAVAADLYTTAFAALEQVCAVNPNVQAYRSMRNNVGLALADVLLADKRFADAARAFEALRPHLITPGDYVTVGGGQARAAAGLRGGDGVPAGPTAGDWRRAAEGAVACLREAKARGDKRTAAEFQKLVPLAALRGAKGYDELLTEWSVPAPKP
jgi:hypothetical protein